jgi:hypothetical protein
MSNNARRLRRRKRQENERRTKFYTELVELGSISTDEDDVEALLGELAREGETEVACWASDGWKGGASQERM